MSVKAIASITLSTVRDVASVWRYYQLVSQTASAPSKPTTNPPGSAWGKTEPAYQASMALYFTDLTVFTDGSFSYSDVSLSSSYTAANQAYNKSESASEKADKGITAVPIVYYRLTDGSTPTAPTDSDSTGWSTSIASATAQLSGGFASGCKYWTCTYTLYGDGSHQWGSVTYAETETTAATNEWNIANTGNYFWHDSQGAHVGYRTSTGSTTNRTDFTSDGVYMYQGTNNVASYSSSGATVGSTSGTYADLDAGGIRFVQASDDSPKTIASLDGGGLSTASARLTELVRIGKIEIRASDNGIKFYEVK